MGNETVTNAAGTDKKHLVREEAPFEVTRPDGSKVNVIATSKSSAEAGVREKDGRAYTARRLSFKEIRELDLSKLETIAPKVKAVKEAAAVAAPAPVAAAPVAVPAEENVAEAPVPSVFGSHF